MTTRELPPIRKVSKLPKKAVENEIIYNKSDGYFYMGVDTEKEVIGYGNHLEKTSISG